MIACATVRGTIAVFLLVGAACGSSPSEAEDTTSTGNDASSTTAESTSTSSSPTTSSSSSDESSSAEGSTGSSSTGTTGDPDPLSASDYCESIVDSFCEFYARCGRMEVASAQACREPFLESCNTVFEPQYVGLEAAGLLTLSAEGLLACEQHLADVECDQQVFELSGPCGALWSGAQSAGERCGLDVEYYVCEPSAACTIGLDFCGTCETVLELGDDCTPDGTTCGPEAFCDTGTCRARVLNGEACTPDDRCMAGSACIDDTCQGPTFVGLDEPCDSTRRCRYLTACVAGVCTATARLGDACSDTTPCESGFCDRGLCQAPLDEGATCEGHGACSSGLCIEGTCAARPSPCITN